MLQVFLLFVAAAGRCVVVTVTLAVAVDWATVVVKICERKLLVSSLCVSTVADKELGIGFASHSRLL